MARERDDELQERVCRACNRTFDYPAYKSTATRFYCADCSDLPVGVRAAFEQFNKRIKALGATVQKLEQKQDATAGAHAARRDQGKQ